MVVACFSTGACVAHRGSHGPVQTPPAAGASGATEDLISQKAAAASRGDSKTAAALATALRDQNDAEINTESRWLIAAGVLVCAIGAGLMAYGAKKLGLAGLACGGALIVGAMAVTSLVPYLPYFALTVVLGGVVALVWFLRQHMRAVDHLIGNVPAQNIAGASKHVESIIKRAIKRTVKI